MNTAPPLEYVISFAEASQTMMQQLTAALLTSGESDADFSRFGRIGASGCNPFRVIKSRRVPTWAVGAFTKSSRHRVVTSRSGPNDLATSTKSCPQKTNDR